MAWTLVTLTRHLFRQNTVRILLLSFALVLLWVQSPRFFGSHVNRVFMDVGAVQASWPRWVVYAWLLVGILRMARPSDRTPVRAPHPLEAATLWHCIRRQWESWVLWVCAELMILGIVWSEGEWFHVEQSQPLSNLVMIQSATIIHVLAGAFFRNRYAILVSLGLWVLFLELQVLHLSSSLDQLRLGGAGLLISVGLAITLNPFGNKRCKSQS